MPLLALGVGRHDGAIGVDDRLLEELGGLLGPDPRAGLRLMASIKVADIGLAEAAAEVPGRGGVGDALGPRASR